MSAVTGHEDHRRPRIVIADDHPSVLRAFQQMLEPECDVLAAVPGGHEAVEAVTRLRPDVLVVDLMLPDVDGLEVCRRLKGSVPDMQIIIVTAFDDDEVRSIALNNGAAAYVPKYSAAGTLTRTVHQLCKNKQST
jgi:CheY-like chemotaxis protein